jgi:ankyrin repeat protein
MSEAKDSKPESYDLLDVVGGGLEKCARTLFGQPGDCDITSSIEKSKSLNNQGGDLKRSEEMEESRGDAEAERSEASSVLPPILSTAAIKISNIAAPEMPDIGGQIEKMTAKVLAVGDCQSREVPYLKSLWAIGNTNNEATQRTNTISKIKDKGSDRLDDASIDSVLSYSSSVDCCALLDTQEREFDRETFWENDGSDEEEEDDDVPNDGATPSASALLVEVATTIDTFKASRNSAVPIIEDPTFAINDEKEITEPEFLLMNTVRSRKSHSPANWSGEEAPIFSSASYESDTSTVTRGAGCSIHKGRRWTSHLRDRTSGGKKKPHVLKHCERGRCPAAPDHATRMMNKASSTLSYAHSSALEAIKGKRWQVLLNLVKANTHILSLHSSAIRGGTILHALAASDDAPDAIVLQILSICPNLAGCLDDTDSTPLHLVAKRSKRPGLVKLFSDYHAPSVSIQNANGDSALHFAASAASEESTLILLNANKNMLTIPNQKQQIPLHAACSCPCPSIQVIRSLLSHHKAIGVLPSSVDKAGNTPLCAAIKNNDSTKIVPVFCKEFPELFRLGNTDTGKSLPLHTALLQPDIDTRTLLCIIEAGPDAAAVPLPSGDLPIVVATRRGLSDDIIYSLLVQDLPIAILGPDEKGVSMKKHNYSWHHVLTSCQESYCNVVNGVLQASNHWQRIALALSPSLFGHLSYNSCSEPMRKSFDVALRIGGRFQIQLLDDIESFSIDREYNVLSAADTAPLKNSDGDEVSS